ncbi:hypothetical protein D0867_04127 [Hortaea werneckii]|uniref:Major facilitator superfamily (MFS) profile domain-containing protein n=1 Tax=Hortaea werneckii TaxID=91943 RepID=A0A3M7B850_HORWE|nr:hypothetical protein D0867_04127 [Hortaea werneckii]RMY35993.1 hypothetical protein D0866_04235 [Hortaea werneckii]
MSSLSYHVMSRYGIKGWQKGQQNDLNIVQEDVDQSEKPSTQMQTPTGSLYHSVPTSVMSQPLTNPFAAGVSTPVSNQTIGSLHTEQCGNYEPSIVESLIPSPLQPGRHRAQQREAELPFPLQRTIIHRPRPAQFASHTVPFGDKSSSPTERIEYPFTTYRDTDNSYDLDLETGIPKDPLPPPQTFQTATSKPQSPPITLQHPSARLHSPQAIEGRKIPNKAPKTLGVIERSPDRPVPNPTLPPKPPVTPSPSTTSSTKTTNLHPKPLPLPPSDPTQPPQNGRIAWLHALTGMLVIFNCWGLANAFGLFEAYYTTYYLPSSSPSAVAWVGSTQLALVFGLGVPVGMVVDRGYFRVMFHGGSVVMVLGVFATAWCERLWEVWLVQGLVTGMGMGMVFCSGIVALMTWFDERKMGIAMGLGAAGSCLGGIVYVLLARHFLVSRGFATTMRILGGVAAVTMIPPNLVFRKRHQTHRLSERRRFDPVLKSRMRKLAAGLSSSYLLAAAGMFFTFLGVYFGYFMMVTFASTELEMSNTAATNLLIFMLAANLPGRFLPALISDKCIGPLNTIVPSIFLSAAVIGLWIASGEPNRAAMIVIACFYGFVSAGVQVLYAPAVYAFCLEQSNNTGRISSRSCTERQPNQMVTDRLGLKAGGIFTCVGLACLIGTPIGGALISYRANRGMDHTYLGAQIFATVSLILGGCLLLASRVAKVGWEARRA